MSMEARADVRLRYRDALEALVADLEQDYYVLAALVYGSVARGEAWERSDLDLTIVMRDGLERLAQFRWLDKDGINISANVVPRSQFKRMLDGALQGSIWHSIRSHAKLLFSKDESITAWFAETSRIGARDQGFQAMRVAANVPGRGGPQRRGAGPRGDPPGAQAQPHLL
jgi:predicted nucleotidyltransferase